MSTQQTYEDEAQDAEATKRDLGYEFQMPIPLDRLLRDVVTGVTTIAQMFDPTQSNTELLRTLLTIVPTELGFEDAAAAVERIYPGGVHRAGDGGCSGSWWPERARAGDESGGADQGEFSSSSMTGAMGDDSQNQYGAGYAGGNPYAALASSQSPEHVAQESRHDPLFQARVQKRLVQTDAMLDDASRTRSRRQAERERARPRERLRPAVAGLEYCVVGGILARVLANRCHRGSS